MKGIAVPEPSRIKALAVVVYGGRAIDYLIKTVTIHIALADAMAPLTFVSL